MSPAGSFPPIRPFARGEVLAPTGAQAAAFDALAMDQLGVPSAVLMESAGRAAAAVLARLYPQGSVMGVVGAGNNGGDALVLLRTLRAWGRDVHVVLAADRPSGDPLLHGWPLPIVTDGELDDEAWAARARSAAVVVDGVLGTGAKGPPRERQAEAIRRINRSGRPVVALDVPSGIDSGTGAVPGDAVRADLTIAFGAPKLGSLLHPAHALVGRQVVVEIGFPPLAAEHAGARVCTPSWARERLPKRGTDTHKNAVGRVTVVAGGPGMGGAAVLAARAAFRAGAGIVRLCCAPENREAVHAGVPEAIIIDWSDAEAIRDALGRSDAVAAGPGLGTGALARAALEAVTSGPALPTVLDADALNIAADGGLDLAALAATRPVLLTPHPGEMARLCPDSRPKAEGSVAVARAAAERFGCATLLKGAPSVVAGVGEPVWIDTQGSSDLAAAGMGDSLTGVTATLLAQGLAPAVAGALGLYLTGRAARLAGRGRGLVPSDVIRWLPDALEEGGAAAEELGLPFVTFDAEPAR